MGTETRHASGKTGVATTSFSLHPPSSHPSVQIILLVLTKVVLFLLLELPKLLYSPSEEYKPASRVFPQLVPQWDEHSSVEENKGAWKRVFSQWTKPLLTLFADSDAVSRGGEKVWIEQCPGAKGQKHAIIKDAGHFIQEDQPEELCERILEFIQDNPVKLYRPASRL